MIFENIAFDGTTYTDVLIFIRNAFVLYSCAVGLAILKCVVHWGESFYILLGKSYHAYGFDEPIPALPEEVDENIPHMNYIRS